MNHQLENLDVNSAARRSLFLLLGMLFLLVLAFMLSQALHVDQRVHNALIGGSCAALATALGCLPAWFAYRIPPRIMDGLLGFGAGVMLAAAAFSLITPGIKAAQNLGAGSWQASLTVAAGILLGAGLLLALERYLPHEHFIKGQECVSPHQAHTIKRVWLFAFAIILHNVPEGLAIGVAYAGSEPAAAAALALGIAIQDIPEGLVIAMALAGVGYSRMHAMAVGMLSGLVEPIAAVLAALLIGTSAQLLPWGLACAAGAMLFVISHEIIPESHRKGHELYATAGLMLGFVLMMLLDTALA